MCTRQNHTCITGYRAGQLEMQYEYYPNSCCRGSGKTALLIYNCGVKQFLGGSLKNLNAKDVREGGTKSF